VGAGRSRGKRAPNRAVCHRETCVNKSIAPPPVEPRPFQVPFQTRTLQPHPFDSVVSPNPEPRTRNPEPPCNHDLRQPDDFPLFGPPQRWISNPLRLLYLQETDQLRIERGLLSRHHAEITRLERSDLSPQVGRYYVINATVDDPTERKLHVLSLRLRDIWRAARSNGSRHDVNQPASNQPEPTVTSEATSKPAPGLPHLIPSSPHPLIDSFDARSPAGIDAAAAEINSAAAAINAAAQEMNAATAVVNATSADLNAVVAVVRRRRAKCTPRGTTPSRSATHSRNRHKSARLASQKIDYGERAEHFDALGANIVDPSTGDIASSTSYDQAFRPRPSTDPAFERHPAPVAFPAARPKVRPAAALAHERARSRSGPLSAVSHRTPPIRTPRIATLAALIILLIAGAAWLAWPASGPVPSKVNGPLPGKVEGSRAFDKGAATRSTLNRSPPAVAAEPTNPATPRAPQPSRRRPPPPLAPNLLSSASGPGIGLLKNYRPLVPRPRWP